MVTYEKQTIYFFNNCTSSIYHLVLEPFFNQLVIIFFKEERGGALTAIIWSWCYRVMYLLSIKFLSKYFVFFAFFQRLKCFMGMGECKVWEATTSRYANVTNTLASFVGLSNHHNPFGTNNQDMLVIS